MTFYLKIILVLILNVLLTFLAITDKKMALISGAALYSKICSLVFKFNRVGNYAPEFAALILEESEFNKLWLVVDTDPDRLDNTTTSIKQ